MPLVAMERWMSSSKAKVGLDTLAIPLNKLESHCNKLSEEVGSFTTILCLLALYFAEAPWAVGRVAALRFIGIGVAEWM
jgi:hypothetical protein